MTTNESQPNTALTEKLNEIANSVEKMRGSNRVERIFLAFIPFLAVIVTVAVTSYIANQELVNSQRLESAKLIAEFNEMIVNGGKSAQLAQIAFASVPLTEAQRMQLAEHFEPETSDTVDLGSNTSFQDGELDELIQSLFSTDRDRRLNTYPVFKDYLASNMSEETLAQIFAYSENYPFLVNGRSNVLDILSNFEKEKLIPYSQQIENELQRILDLESGSVAHAIGPKTKGWIKEIRVKLKS